MAETVLFVVGPTAVGKSDLSLDLAEQLHGEIVSADSMQVYRGMDIGTAKTPVAERRGIRHHLIDVADPLDEFTVYDYARLAREAIGDIFARGRLPIVVGGTGLYVRALTDGLDFSATPKDSRLRDELQAFATARGAPALHERLRELDPIAAAKLHPNDARRIIRAMEICLSAGGPVDSNRGFAPPPYRTLKLGLTDSRDRLYVRIDARVERMIAQGLKDEVERLRACGCSREHASMQAIGYKEMLAALEGRSTLAEAEEAVKRASRRYAKRQLSWFRADPSIRWYLVSEDGMMKTVPQGILIHDVAEHVATLLEEA